MTDVPHGSTSAEKPVRLQGGVLTVPNAIALSAAAMAPVLAVVLNAPAAAAAAGAALPLSFLIAFVAAALVGNTVVQFSRRLPSAGSFYTFNSQGLGSGGRLLHRLAVLDRICRAGARALLCIRGVRARLRAGDLRSRRPVVVLQSGRPGDHRRAVTSQHQGVRQSGPDPARPRGRHLPHPRRDGHRHCRSRQHRCRCSSRRPHPRASPASDSGWSSDSCPSSGSTPPRRSAKRPATPGAASRSRSPVRLAP